MEESPLTCLPCSGTNSIAEQSRKLLKCMIGESMTLNAREVVQAEEEKKETFCGRKYMWADSGLH